MKSERDVVQEAERRLRQCLTDVPFVEVLGVELHLSSGNPDMVAALNQPGGRVTLVIEASTNGQPRFARAALERLRGHKETYPGSYGVFVAPYVSPRSAALCEAEDVGYLDLAGNCRLCFGQVYIKTVAHQNPFVERRELRSLFGPRSTKTGAVLRVLLSHPRRVWKTQELAEEAGVSLGQVSNVRKRLADREWIGNEAPGFRLIDPVALLTEWADNYDAQQHTSHPFYSLDSVPEIESRLAEVCEQLRVRYALTGHAGAARYVPVVRYAKVHAYAEGRRLAEVAEAMGLKQVPTGPNVVLIDPYDPNVLSGAREVRGASVASLAQLYLDLRNTAARGEDAAEALLREEIAPQWQ